MKRIINILLIAFLFASCEKYPGPGDETIEMFYYNLIGNHQSAEVNNYLPLEVGAQIDLNSLLPQEKTNFKMKIEVISGGGSVDANTVAATPYGLMTTKWRLGNKSNEQILSCQIFNGNNDLYTEFEIEATAFFLNDWNEINQGFLVGIRDMIYDTTRQRTMMYNDGQIWVLKDNFYSWESKGAPFNETVRFLDMTSDGTVFAAGWRGALYKSENWGESWEYVCQPIPGNEYYYNFNISSDDYLWATKNSLGIYCSKDKGLTWSEDTTERVKDSFLGPIYKYKDSYMTIADWPLSIVQKQNGIPGWHDIKTPEYSLSMYVPNDSTIIAQNQGGFRLHKSTDDGLSFEQVFAPHTTMGGGNLWHVYNRFGNNYFVLAPSSGLWQTKDFEEFEQLILITTFQSKIFIDHTGTLYVVGSKFVNAEDEATYIFPHFE